jgi:hypothetical protein
MNAPLPVGLKNSPYSNHNFSSIILFAVMILGGLTITCPKIASNVNSH